MHFMSGSGRESSAPGIMAEEAQQEQHQRQNEAFSAVYGPGRDEEYKRYGNACQGEIAADQCGKQTAEAGYEAPQRGVYQQKRRGCRNGLSAGEAAPERQGMPEAGTQPGIVQDDPSLVLEQVPGKAHGKQALRKIAAEYGNPGLEAQVGHHISHARIAGSPELRYRLVRDCAGYDFTGQNTADEVGECKCSNTFLHGSIVYDGAHRCTAENNG